MSEHLFSPDSPWERCYQDFLRSLQRRSGSTTSIRIYQGILTRFFAGSANGGPAKAPDLYTREDVESFIAQKSDKPWTRSPDGSPAIATQNLRLTVLSSFYKYAATYTITGPDGLPQVLLQRPSPTTGIRGGKPDLSYKAFSFEEFTRFFDAIPTDTPLGARDRAVFLTYFWTARRRSEIARLTWGDIERAMIIEPDGKRRMGYIYHFRGKAHANEDDIAELPEPAMRAIETYLQVSGRKDTIQPSEPLFLAIGHEHGGNVRPGEKRALTQAGIIRRMEYYAEQAGIAHISLHSFRHFAARERFDAGQSILSIQELLRHQSLNTTHRYLWRKIRAADPGAKLLEDKYGRFS